MVGAVQGSSVVTQIGKLIAIVGGIGANLIVEISHMVTVTQVDLYTTVHHIAHITLRGGVAGIGRDGHVHKHTGGELVVEIKGSGDAVAQETSLQT